MEKQINQNRLTGKVAIVTGASSGIGKAVAKDLGRIGVKLVLTARRKDQLQELQKEIPEAVIVDGDIVSKDFPEKLLNKTVESFGKCDILVHAAGSMYTSTVEDANIDALCDMVNLNLEASVRLTYTVIKYFKSTGSGHLVHLSSILGTKTRTTAGVYAASKYGIEALVESLRMELAGTNIKISAIEPGLTITELHNKFPVHPAKALGVVAPLQAEDIANCIRFVLDQPDHVRIPVLMVLPGEQSI